VSKIVSFVIIFVEQTFAKKLQSWAAPSLPGYIGALYLCVPPMASGTYT